MFAPRCALTAVVAVFGLTACDPECVDRFDCRAKGINLTCQKSRCVPDPDKPFPRRVVPVDPRGPVIVAETSCDGLDNDGDGRVDVSAPVHLAASHSKSSTSWAASDQGIAVGTVVSRDRHVIAFSFPNVPSLDVEVGRHPPLTPGFGPSVAWWNDSVVASWHTVDGGVDYMHVGRWQLDGGALFEAAGHFPADVRWQRTHNSADEPGAIVAQDGACALIAWSDSCNRFSVMAATIDGAGNTIAGPAGLAASPAACHSPLHRNVVAGSNGFVVLEPDRHFSATHFVAKTFDCALNENLALRRIFPLDVTAGVVPVVTEVRLDADGAPVTLLATDGQLSHELNAFELATDGGTVLMRTSPGFLSAFGQPFILSVGVPMLVESDPNGPVRATRRDAHSIDVSIRNSVIVANPPALHLGGNVYAVAADVNGPAGQQFAISFFCAP